MSTMKVSMGLGFAQGLYVVVVCSKETGNMLNGNQVSCPRDMK